MLEDFLGRLFLPLPEPEGSSRHDLDSMCSPDFPELPVFDYERQIQLCAGSYILRPSIANNKVMEY